MLVVNNNKTQYLKFVSLWGQYFPQRWALEMHGGVCSCHDVCVNIMGGASDAACSKNTCFCHTRKSSVFSPHFGSAIKNHEVEYTYVIA